MSKKKPSYFIEENETLKKKKKFNDTNGPK